MGGGNSSLKGTSKSSRAYKKSVKEISDRIRNQDYESAYAIDDEGKLVTEPIDGDIGSVGSDEFDEKSFGQHVIHNHPEDGTFSVSDIGKLIDQELKSLRAVGKKNNFLIQPKDGKLPSESSREMFYNAYRNADYNLHNEARKEIMDEIGKLPTPEARWEAMDRYESMVLARWEAKCHTWLQNHSSDYGYEYSRTSVKGRKR